MLLHLFSSLGFCFPLSHFPILSHYCYCFCIFWKAYMGMGGILDCLVYSGKLITLECFRGGGSWLVPSMIDFICYFAFCGSQQFVSKLLCLICANERMLGVVFTSNNIGVPSWLTPKSIPYSLQGKTELITFAAAIAISSIFLLYPFDYFCCCVW